MTNGTFISIFQAASMPDTITSFSLLSQVFIPRAPVVYSALRNFTVSPSHVMKAEFLAAVHMNLHAIVRRLVVCEIDSGLIDRRGMMLRYPGQLATTFIWGSAKHVGTRRS